MAGGNRLLSYDFQTESDQIKSPRVPNEFLFVRRNDDDAEMRKHNHRGLTRSLINMYLTYELTNENRMSPKNSVPWKLIKRPSDLFQSRQTGFLHTKWYKMYNILMSETNASLYDQWSRKTWVEFFPGLSVANQAPPTPNRAACSWMENLMAIL